MNQNEIGLIPPPPGIIPNFNNPPSTGYKVIITAMVTWGLASVLVLLRVIVKLRITWFLVVAWVFATGLSFLSYPYVYHSGLGRDAWNITFSTFNPSFLQSIIAYAALYTTSICFTKLSILILYIRLTQYRSLRLLVYALMFVVVAYSLILIIQIIFRCHPIRKTWDLTVTYGSCLSIVTIGLVNGFINTITDGFLLLLPIFIVRGMLMPMRQKLLIAFILMTSSFIFIISIIRLAETFSSLSLTNPTKNYVRATLYGLLEANVAVFCACLPYMKPLLIKLCPRFIGEEERSSAPVPIIGPSPHITTQMDEAT